MADTAFPHRAFSYIYRAMGHADNPVPGGLVAKWIIIHHHLKPLCVDIWTQHNPHFATRHLEAGGLSLQTHAALAADDVGTMSSGSICPSRSRLSHASGYSGQVAQSQAFSCHPVCRGLRRAQAGHPDLHHSFRTGADIAFRTETGAIQIIL